MKQPVLEEEDIKKIFVKPRKKSYGRNFWRFLKSLFNFAVLFILFFFLINLPAYSQKIDYFWKVKILKTEYKTANEKIAALAKAEPDAQQLEAIRQEKERQNNEILNKKLLEIIGNNQIRIPAISVSAPVIWESLPENIIEDLKNGVSHYKGTALPGQANGNVFITGHSSNFFWDDGKYKEIFALLDKLKTGDRIYATHNNQVYIYSVENTKIISPTQVEALNPQDHSIVSLMTCYPVGTTLNRLVVQGKQIFPEEKPAVSPSAKVSDKLKYLPAIR